MRARQRMACGDLFGRAEQGEQEVEEVLNDEPERAAGLANVEHDVRASIARRGEGEDCYPSGEGGRERRGFDALSNALRVKPKRRAPPLPLR